MNSPSFTDILVGGAPLLLFVTEKRDDALAEVLSYASTHDYMRIVYNVKQFGVDEAEMLSRDSQSLTLKEKMCIVSAASLHWVAQNKILKTLEDAHSHVRFVFILESTSSVLPTILSRMKVYDMSFDSKPSERVMLFLSTKKISRMDIPFVKKLLSLKDKDDKKDREESLRFLRELYKASVVLQMNVGSQSLLLSFLSLGSSPSASFKMIFECLALSLPSVVE